MGRTDTGRFLLLPADAVQILDDLAAGSSVGEARQHHERRYGETPDLEDLLTELEEHGFVRPASAPAQDTRTRYHFEWIGRRLAARIFGCFTLTAGAMLVLLAAVAIIARPLIVPGWRAAYFPTNTAAGLLFLMLAGLFTTFLHEMGHLVAARARGVSCRFAIGNQLWFLTWETDMTGVWALPRRKRYLPILGGPLVDLFSASAIVVALFAADAGWIGVAPRILQYGRALLFLYLMRMLWQCYFFLRTDFYYALTNLFGCRNLMADTVAYLKNAFHIQRADLGAVRAHELRMVRVYAWIWVTGRALAFAMLLFVQLPLLFEYLMLLADRARGYGAPAGDPTMPLVAALTFSLFFFAGLGMWLRRLWKGSRA